MEVLRCDSLDQWREEFMTQVKKADFHPYNDTPFKAMLQLPLGLPGVVRCRFNAGTFIRTPALAKTEQEDAFQILATEVGAVHAEFSRQQFQIDKGEAAVTHVAEPLRLSSSTRFGGLTLIIPRAELEARGVRGSAAEMQGLTPRCEALRLLKLYARAVEKSGIRHANVLDAPAALHETVQRYIHDLAALAIAWRGVVGETDLNAVADTRLQIALGYIAEHFDDPQLTVEAVARQQGVSARYLQRLMESAGRSFTTVVNELRLQKAHTALTAETPDKRSILNIALEAGFSNLSYFNRLFRARFGDTPGGVRGGRESKQH
jgi:AraC-like DNA-binding protein